MDSYGDGSNIGELSVAVGWPMPSGLPQSTRLVPITRRSEEPSGAEHKGMPVNTGNWAKVASEVARMEPRAEMDFEVVKAIADQERAGRR